MKKNHYNFRLRQLRFVVVIPCKYVISPWI